MHGKAILTRTGKIWIVANHHCDEYHAVEGNKLERVTINAGVLTRVSGAKEMIEFGRKMVARLDGGKSERSEGMTQPG